MKNYFLILPAVLLSGVAALAASPTYKTMSASGNAASPASVTFPADPYGTQVRVIGVNYSTDTNNSVLSFASGTTVYTQTATNQATSSVTNQINSTNGLSVGATLVLQHGGVCYANTVLTWNQSTNIASPYQGTNVVLNSGGWAVAASAGDPVYLMGAATTLPAPAASSGSTTSAAVNGEAIYVGSLAGRPVTVTITPAFATNKLNSVTAHYD
jgi:hypothetical protein